jgi:endosialidase-like protein
MPNPSKRTDIESAQVVSRLMRSRPSPSMAVALAALFVALSGTAIAAQVATTSQGKASERAEASKQRAKKKAKRGPAGPAGPQGPPGPSTGPAGGALAGTYPDPTLNVSGGDNGPNACRNGEAVLGLSASATLTCSVGVYSDADENVAAGPTTFPALTTGITNSALGNLALGLNTSGAENSAFGQIALAKNTVGLRNTAVGQATLANNTAGHNNSALGEDSLLNNNSGNSNSVVGMHALDANTTGSNNVALGMQAGNSLTIGDNNIDISNAGVTGESATTRIGTQGVQTSAYVAGVSGTNLGAVPNVVVNTNGQLGVDASSQRFKTDIQPLRSPDGLMKLKPVSFRYRAADVSGPNPTEFGLLAEQVANVYPNLVTRGNDGKPYTVLYQQLPVLLLARDQQQQRLNTSLKSDNRRLEAENARQQAQIDQLMRLVRR